VKEKRTAQVVAITSIRTMHMHLSGYDYLLVTARRTKRFSQLEGN